MGAVSAAEHPKGSKKYQELNQLIVEFLILVVKNGQKVTIEPSVPGLEAHRIDLERQSTDEKYNKMLEIGRRVAQNVKTAPQRKFN